MLKLTYNEFIENYNVYKRFPMGMYTPEKKLNDKQLMAYYKKYCSKVDKENKKREEYYDNLDKHDSLLPETKNFVRMRDKNCCRLWAVLSFDERDIAIANGYDNYFSKQLTFTHVIPRSLRKDLINDILNVYQVSLLFHQRLDQFKDPLTGKFIPKHKVDFWWRRIINDDEVYNYLTKR